MTNFNEIPLVLREYIDGLDDAGRDRIIAGPLGRVGGRQTYTLCVMQLGENVCGQDGGLYIGRCVARTGMAAPYAIADAYDQFIWEAANMDDAIAAVKAYAARNNSSVYTSTQKAE